jgi:hypothetical protein
METGNLVEIKDASRATIVRLTLGDHTEDCTPVDAVERAGKLYQLHGTFPAFRYFAPVNGAPTSPISGNATPAPQNVAAPSENAPSVPQNAAPAPQNVAAPSEVPTKAEPPTGAALGFSNFGGGLVLDAAAKVRMERIYDRLEAAGVEGIKRDTTPAGYAPGTRMAEIGYRNQEARRAEYLRLLPARDVLSAITKRVQEEGRSDVTIGSREFADKIQANGKIRVMDLRLGEQAIRGLIGRIKSPAIGYALGLRERIAMEYSKRDPETGKPCGDEAALHSDVAALAEVLRHECKRLPEMELKLRTRAKPGDIFAITSPRFANADAPEVCNEIEGQIPRDARATFSYDPRTTQWTIRFDVWTPTPVADQAVGEPFKGFASIGGRDNGTGSLEGGGGIVVLACLNAGTYVADGVDVSRRHLGRILVDVGAMLKAACASIDTLCAAWGAAREAEIAIPEKLTIQDAIPGFYRYLLTDRRSELVSVLPGRTEKHVANLAAAFTAERRDDSRIVRADLAQGWTRYAQAFPADVQRDAETAIGAWTVRAKPVGCVFRAPAKD